MAVPALPSLLTWSLLLRVLEITDIEAPGPEIRPSRDDVSIEPAGGSVSPSSAVPGVAGRPDDELRRQPDRRHPATFDPFDEHRHRPSPIVRNGLRTLVRAVGSSAGMLTASYATTATS